MRIIASNERVGTSQMELYTLKIVYLLTFKRFKALKRQMQQVTEDLETVKHRKVF
ncbi:hypothetical protein [Lentibacillus sediminis]|uniref:hypothetical protein n=1 Tax=Lentibacillus sediminis TaxID=1940529 RepID=UPI0013041D84|nr:hypothetical protein [Lentibacillus sediminis]